MKDRSARKQFLIAESELSRSRFIEDCASLTADFRKIGTRAAPFKPAISAAALAISGLAAIQRGFRKPMQDAGKTSWLRTLLKGAGIASTVWLALQTPRRDRREPRWRPPPVGLPPMAEKTRQRQGGGRMGTLPSRIQPPIKYP